MSDDQMNNIMATGAVMAVLHMGMADTALDSVHTVCDDDGNATNHIDVTFEFAKSTYRLTVERVKGEDE